MAEQLNTPTIYIQLGTPVIDLVTVSGNILESCKLTSPHGREDECAKFIISDIEDAYGLREIMAIGTEYTLSFWMKSNVSGYVRTSGEGTFKASSEWQKCVVTFKAEDEDLVLSFDKEGTYYIYHIQLELGNTATDYRPANEDVDEGISTAQKAADDAQKAADKNAEDMASNVLKFNQDIKGLQDQLDANVTIWYGEVTPSISNEPAVNWKDNKTRDLHIGDMYYDTKTGYAYRWIYAAGMYSWEKIEDQDVVKSLKDAAKAQDTADQKRRVFIAQPVPPYDEGDLWAQGEKGDILRCATKKAEGEEFAESDWVKTSKYTDDSKFIAFINGDYAKAIDSINSQIDQKAETWYQEEDPSSAWTTTKLKESHVGDLWYNTKENKSYIYLFAQPDLTNPNPVEPADGQLAAPYITITDYIWCESDGVPQEVYDKINKKAQIFTSQPTHPYYVKDLWVQPALTDEDKAGDILVCIQKSTEAEGFNADHWKPASKYTDNAELISFIEQYNKDYDYISKQLDGKAETWCQPTDPSLDWKDEDTRRLHIGDLWLNPNTKESYIYTASISDRKTSTPADNQLEIPYIGLYSWEATFEIPQSVFDDIDGKAQIFATQPVGPYYEGDLWVQPAITDKEGNVIQEAGDIATCIIENLTKGAFDESHWTKASKYTDDSALNNALDGDGTVTYLTDDNGNPIYEGKNKTRVYKRDDGSYYYTNMIGVEVDVGPEFLVYVETDDEENEVEVEYDANSQTQKPKQYRVYGGLSEEMSNVKAELLKTADQIGIMVQTSAKASDLSDVAQKLNAFIGNEEGFIMTFDAFYKVATDGINGQQEKWKVQEDYIKFSDGNIYLGSSGSNTQAILTKTRLAFTVNGVEVAYFSNKMLVVKEVAIESQLTYFGEWATRRGAFIESANAYNLNDVFLGPSKKVLLSPIIRLETVG